MCRACRRSPPLQPLHSEGERYEFRHGRRGRGLFLADALPKECAQDQLAWRGRRARSQMQDQGRLEDGRGLVLALAHDEPPPQPAHAGVPLHELRVRSGARRLLLAADVVLCDDAPGRQQLALRCRRRYPEQGSRLQVVPVHIHRCTAGCGQQCHAGDLEPRTLGRAVRLRRRRLRQTRACGNRIAALARAHSNDARALRAHFVDINRNHKLAVAARDNDAAADADRYAKHREESRACHHHFPTRADLHRRHRCWLCLGRLPDGLLPVRAALRPGVCVDGNSRFQEFPAPQD